MIGMSSVDVNNRGIVGFLRLSKLVREVVFVGCRFREVWMRNFYIVDIFVFGYNCLWFSCWLYGLSNRRFFDFCIICMYYLLK